MNAQHKTPDEVTQPSPWNVPNALTVLRILLVPVFAVLAFQGRNSWNAYLIALVVFCVAALTDRIDGKLARKRGLVTNFGKIADPFADKVLMITAFVILSIIGVVPWWFTIVVTVRELAVTGLRFVLLRRGRVLPASQGGKLKTALQVLLVVLIMSSQLVDRYSQPVGVGLAYASVLVLVAAFAVTVITGILYFTDAYNDNKKAARAQARGAERDRAAVSQPAGARRRGEGEHSARAEAPGRDSGARAEKERRGERAGAKRSAEGSRPGAGPRRESGRGADARRRPIEARRQSAAAAQAQPPQRAEQSRRTGEIAKAGLAAKKAAEARRTGEMPKIDAAKRQASAPERRGGAEGAHPTTRPQTPAQKAAASAVAGVRAQEAAKAADQSIPISRIPQIPSTTAPQPPRPDRAAAERASEADSARPARVASGPAAASSAPARPAPKPTPQEVVSQEEAPTRERAPKPPEPVTAADAIEKVKAAAAQRGERHDEASRTSETSDPRVDTVALTAGAETRDRSEVPAHADEPVRAEEAAGDKAQRADVVSTSDAARPEAEDTTAREETAPRETADDSAVETGHAATDDLSREWGQVGEDDFWKRSRYAQVLPPEPEDRPASAEKDRDELLAQLRGEREFFTSAVAEHAEKVSSEPNRADTRADDTLQSVINQTEERLRRLEEFLAQETGFASEAESKSPSAPLWPPAHRPAETAATGLAADSLARRSLIEDLPDQPSLPDRDTAAPSEPVGEPQSPTLPERGSGVELRVEPGAEIPAEPDKTSSAEEAPEKEAAAAFADIPPAPPLSSADMVIPSFFVPGPPVDTADIEAPVATPAPKRPDRGAEADDTDAASSEHTAPKASSKAAAPLPPGAGLGTADLFVPPPPPAWE